MALTKITNSAIADDIGLGGNPTTSTQTAGNSTTRIATTAFVSTAVANLVDSAPETLNTLAELATSIGNNATLSSTLTTSIATKLPLAGGTMTGNLNLGDNVRARFGTGNDLQLWHNGTFSILDGGDFLRLRATNDVKIQNYNSTATMAIFTPGGSAELRFDNDAKLATTNTGIDVTGNVSLPDNGKAIFGTGNDLQIYHNTTNSIVADTGSGFLSLQSNGTEIALYDTANNANMGRFITGGAVNLFHNGNTKFQTTATGIDVTGNIGVTGTVDGIDIAARDAVLTSTTTTAGAALPKAGGTMTGALIVNNNIKFGASTNRALLTSNAVYSYIGQTNAGTENPESNSAYFFGINPRMGTDRTLVVEARTADGAGDIVFKAGSGSYSTGAPERMRIYSSGTVKISHADTASEGLRVIQTTAARTSGGALGLFYDDQAGTTQPTLKVIQNGTGDILQLFDGANQVVTVEDGGNVGIGTGAPANKLHVKAGASGATTFDSRYNLTLEDNGENYLGIYAPNNSFSGVRFVNADNSIRGHIDYYLGTQGDKFVMYSQNGWDFQYPSVGLQQQFKPNGNVNLGATHAGFSGWRVLNIRQSSSGGMVNFDEDDGTRAFTFANQGVGMRYQAHITGGYHRWETHAMGGGTAMMITDAGNVGIGTAAPGHLLDILKSGSGDAAIQIKSTTGGDPTLIFNSAAANRQGIIKFQDNGTNVGRIDYVHNGDRIDIQAGSASGATMSIENGKVGIGESDPDDTLTINVNEGSNNVRAIHLVGGPDVTEKYISIGRTHTVSNDHINSEIRFGCETGGNGNAYMAFAVNGNPTAQERMRIDSSGNIMIGAADVNPWNDTSGNGGIVMRQDGVLSSARLNAEPLLLNRIGTDGELVKLNKAGVTVGHIGAFYGYSYFGNANANTNGIIFTPAGIEPFNSSTAASDKDTDINLGASNQRFKNLYLSGASYIPDVRSTGIQYFTNTTDVRFRNSTGTEHMRLGAGVSTGNMALGLIGVTGVNSEAAIHGKSTDATLVVTNTDLAGASAWGWTGRGGRVLTSNGTNWTNDGKDAALVIGSNIGTTQRGGGLGIVLHNESNVNSNFSPGLYFSTQSESTAYNTAYGYIMGRKTGSGGDTNWSTGEIHMDTAGTRTGSNSRNNYMDDDPAFKIDNAGDISMPYKAYAYGRINGSSISGITNNYGIAITTTRYQNCTPQTNSTHGPGVTITKAGFYILNMSLLYSPSTYAYIGWCVNGSQIHHWHSNHAVSSNHDAVSQIGRYLNIGDHVSIENSNQSISTIYGSSHSAWYIAKIG